MSTRIQPDSAALEIARSILSLDLPLDQLMKHTVFRICLENVARRHMQRRERRDLKKLQANDID